MLLVASKFQSVRNNNVPPDTYTRNRHKCIEYVPRGYCTIILFDLFPPGRVCWRRCISSDQCNVLESSFIYEYFLLTIYQFTINFHLQVNSNKCIVKPPTKSYVIYSRSLQYPPYYAIPLIPITGPMRIGYP